MTNKGEQNKRDKRVKSWRGRKKGRGRGDNKWKEGSAAAAVKFNATAGGVQDGVSGRHGLGTPPPAAPLSGQSTRTAAMQQSEYIHHYLLLELYLDRYNNTKN